MTQHEISLKEEKNYKKRKTTEEGRKEGLQNRRGRKEGNREEVPKYDMKKEKKEKEKKTKAKKMQVLVCPWFLLPRYAEEKGFYDSALSKGRFIQPQGTNGWMSRL